MARILTDGAEMGDLLFWDYIYSADISVQPTATYGGSGVYVYQITWSSYLYKNINPISECYFKLRYRGDPVSRNDGAEQKMFGFYKDGTALAWFGPNHTGQMCLYVNGTVVATATPVLSDATWYLFEGYFKLDDTSGSGVLKRNGIVELTYSGDTKPGTDATFNRILIQGAASGMGAVYMRFDDLAVNDVSGSVDNSWIGAGRVEVLKANAEGDTLEWTPSSGGAHWDCVDDIPTNGDTDYVTSGSIGQRDMFNMAAFTETNKTVQRIWVEARAQDYSAQASRMRVGFKTSGSLFMADPVALPGAYTRVITPVYITNPMTGNVWSKVDLDALQVVVESADG